METKKKLLMTFKTEEGKKVSLSIENPRTDVRNWHNRIWLSIMDTNMQSLIANVGFPIAISMYLLVRIEGKLNCLTDSINELSKNITTIKY